MLNLVVERTRTLDRRIAARNARECAGGLLVLAFFSWVALRAPSTLEQLGSAIVAAAGLWIVYYTLRHGRGPAPADKGVDLESYRQVLLQNYDRQIQLLQTLQYWYLGPPYLGLLIINAGTALRLTRAGQNATAPLLAVALITVVFAWILILNRRRGVAHLRAQRRNLLELTGGE